MALVYIAGGVVLGLDGRIAIVSQGDSWSLPKGHKEIGENDEQTARREIYEETGITELKLIEKLGSYTRGQIRQGGIGEIKENQRNITIFLFTTLQTELNPIDKDNPLALWVKLDDVAKKLTHKKDKEFFETIKDRVKAFLAS